LSSLETFTEGGDENPLFFLLKIKFVSEFEKDEKVKKQKDPGGNGGSDCGR
jgi:hypothetical protein